VELRMNSPNMLSLNLQLTQLAVDSIVVPLYALVDGLLRYKNRVWVRNMPSLHTRIIAALHNSPLGGHSGIPVTLRKLNQFFLGLE
jgi:hypothetical protein